MFRQCKYFFQLRLNKTILSIDTHSIQLAVLQSTRATREIRNFSADFCVEMKVIVLAIQHSTDSIQTDQSLKLIEFCTECSNCIDISKQSSYLICQKCNLFYHQRCISSTITKTPNDWLCPRCNECNSCGHRIIQSSVSIQCSSCKNYFHKSQPNCTATGHNLLLGDLNELIGNVLIA